MEKVIKISERLKALRLDGGLTQAQLAKELNIGQTTVAAYENGTHDPQIYSLIAYADFFKCTLDYLVGREDELGNVIVYDGQLSEEEKKLLSVHRLLNSNYKKLLKEIAIMMINRT